MKTMYDIYMEQLANKGKALPEFPVDELKHIGFTPEGEKALIETLNAYETHGHDPSGLFSCLENLDQTASDTLTESVLEVAAESSPELSILGTTIATIGTLGAGLCSATLAYLSWTDRIDWGRKSRNNSEHSR